jgi:hypothetical protein
MNSGGTRDSGGLTIPPVQTPPLLGTTSDKEMNSDFIHRVQTTSPHHHQLQSIPSVENPQLISASQTSQNFLNPHPPQQVHPSLGNSYFSRAVPTMSNLSPHPNRNMLMQNQLFQQQQPDMAPTQYSSPVSSAYSTYFQSPTLNMGALTQNYPLGRQPLTPSMLPSIYRPATNVYTLYQQRFGRPQYKVRHIGGYDRDLSPSPEPPKTPPEEFELDETDSDDEDIDDGTYADSDDDWRPGKNKHKLKKQKKKSKDGFIDYSDGNSILTENPAVNTSGRRSARRRSMPQRFVEIVQSELQGDQQFNPAVNFQGTGEPHFTHRKSRWNKVETDGTFEEPFSSRDAMNVPTRFSSRTAPRVSYKEDTDEELSEEEQKPQKRILVDSERIDSVLDHDIFVKGTNIKLEDWKDMAPSQRKTLLLSSDATIKSKETVSVNKEDQSTIASPDEEEIRVDIGKTKK